MAVAFTVQFTVLLILTSLTSRTVDVEAATYRLNTCGCSRVSVDSCRYCFRDNSTFYYNDNSWNTHIHPLTPGISSGVTNVSLLMFSSRMTDFRIERQARRRAFLIVLCLLLAGDVELNPGPPTSRTVSDASITFACLNARSIRDAKKVAALHDVIADRSIDLLALTETWVKPDDPPAVANDPAPAGYNILHVIRQQAALVCQSTPLSSSVLGGGLAVVYRDTMTVRPHPFVNQLQQPSTFEIQLIRVGFGPQFTAIANVYRRPTPDINQFIEELGNTIANIIVGCGDRLVLCGDLNCGAPDCGLDPRLSELLFEFGLTQHVNEPTRQDRLLDVIAADNNVCINNVRVSDSLGISDHCLVTAELSCPSAIQSTIRAVNRRSYSRFDPVAFENRLRASRLFSSPADNVDEYADLLEREVVAALDVICPARTRCRRSARYQRPPLSPEANASKRRRRRLERRWLLTRNADDRVKFRQCCRHTNQLINASRRQHVSRTLERCNNARQRWKAVRQLLHSDNKTVVHANRPSSDMCNSFANYFTSKILKIKADIVNQLSVHSPIHIIDPPCTQSHLFNLSTVSAAEVAKLLSSIPAKSSSLDYVPTAIIKSCSSVFSELIRPSLNMPWSRLY